MNYIDIGINLTNKQFQNDIDDVVQDALDADVSQMILTGTSVRNSEESAKIARQYPGVLYATAGIHPHDAKSFDAQSISKLKKLLQLKHVVSVGECGLDFDRDFSPRNKQEECYKAQLELAIEVQKPLFLHERSAFNSFMNSTKTIYRNCQKPLCIVLRELCRKQKPISITDFIWVLRERFQMPSVSAI